MNGHRTSHRARRRTLALAAATGLLSVAAPAAAPATAAAAPPAVAGQLLVGFERGVSKARQTQLLDTAGARIARRYDAVRGGRLVLVRARGGAALSAIRSRLSRAGGVAYAEPDYVLAATQTRTPDDPLYSRQYALVDGPAGHDVDAPTAWARRTSCARVAILDTGIDTDHPDLAANVYKSADKPNNGKDDDHNGYVDDTYGFDAAAGKGSGEDDDGHGTHVAGIVAARTNDALGVAGTCWSAKLLAVKFMNSRGKGSTSNAIAGIQYAVRQGVKIVNCSFGSSANSSSLKDAIGYAQDHGVLLVVAAGNDSENIDRQPSYPASYANSNILTVAASDDEDRLASFSDYGATAVDVAAPGDDILSTYLGGGYKTLSGTSMAAPYVAGVAALLRKQEPDASYADLRYAIRGHADAVPALSGKVASGGRLNAAKALAAIPALVD
ncbi:S8 family peptidase [Conexibacter woesei]|uniref:Peptidase S8 and S53 subtilisin kexin sedolisin n=1 Tax=Conexibacter woesei (strain DSM 14684 / CCUG 47730 / CIP 108061 / JCM 11494 / NBRC 100937 / ID131577) TaxID=469383 RepID=D3F637_CONWI|nr:S8 family peptidase [Conexibacter woesei]ADB48710.1 peptidase S8 and S53 subtilisin kexin sedolisin [Conexibacter woesei DSM 14684]